MYEDGHMQRCRVVKKHPPAQDKHRSRFHWINSFPLGEAFCFPFSRQPIFSSLPRITTAVSVPNGTSFLFSVTILPALRIIFRIIFHRFIFVFQLFYSLFKSLHGKEMLIELKNDLRIRCCFVIHLFQASVGMLISFNIRGKLHSVDQYLNFKLTGLLVFNFHNRMCL